MVTIRAVGPEELLGLLAAIDRSEHVEQVYGVADGRLVDRPVLVADIPPLDADGDGPHSVAAKGAFCAAVVTDHDGIVLGAYDDGRPTGIAVVSATFDPPLAWFAYLDVNRSDRRRGVASALWDAALDRCRDRGAAQLYVSATPTSSAVGFYLSRGCRLADPVHPALFQEEPEDVHLVVDLGAPASARLGS